MQLSIIIVNYNVKYFAEQCIYSVINAIKNIEAEIILVDNNSTDGSNNYLKNKFDSVRFIWSNENLGFSKANNNALKQAQGKYILFLNPDTIIPEDCLEKCMAFYASRTDIGALGVRMVDGSGRFLKESKRGFPSPLTSFFKLGGATALFPHSKFFAPYYLGHLPEHQSNYAAVLSGAFMMVEKKILDKTGGFDESFFMYGEDIDLSYRIQKEGYKNYYFAESTIIHFKGESTKKETIYYVNLFYGAMVLFVNKHYSSAQAIFYIIFIRAAIRIKAAGKFLKGKFKIAKSSQNNSETKQLQTVIVASEKDYHYILDSVKGINSTIKIIGRVSPEKDLFAGSMGDLENLQSIIKQNEIKNIIFSINELTAKKCISIIQTNATNINYSFHMANSKSIVSSNDKNEAGDFIGFEND